MSYIKGQAVTLPPHKRGIRWIRRGPRENEERCPSRNGTITTVFTRAGDGHKPGDAIATCTTCGAGKFLSVR